MSPIVCPVWMSCLLNNPVRRLFQNPDKILGGLLRSCETAVDLGCGPGFFTLGMARIVGEGGTVIAADLQPEMLEIVRREAKFSGLEDRIAYHQCEKEKIGLTKQVDFALAFYAAHETPDPYAFLREVATLLKPGGRFLLVEPIFHVREAQFLRFVEATCSGGLKRQPGAPRVRASRAALFLKPE